MKLECASLTVSLSLFIMMLHVARLHHTSVVLSDGAILVMGGVSGDLSGDYLMDFKNDVWKTPDGGASWIMITSSAGWTGKDSLAIFLSFYWECVDYIGHSRCLYLWLYLW